MVAGRCCLVDWIGCLGGGEARVVLEAVSYREHPIRVSLGFFLNSGWQEQASFDAGAASPAELSDMAQPCRCYRHTTLKSLNSNSVGNVHGFHTFFFHGRVTSREELCNHNLEL